MYTLAQVCKKMGTTRQALRGYEDMGLLPPTEIAANGQWMYDDLALSRLGVIQIFTEADYSRKKIKEILENPQTIYDEMEKAIELLEEKKKHIEGYITTLKLFVKFRDMPEETKRLAGETFDLASFTEKKNFSEYLDDLITISSRHTDSERNQMLEFGPFVTHFALLAKSKGLPPDSPEIQAEVGALLKDVIAVLMEKQVESGDFKDEEERAEYEQYFTSETIGGSIAETLLEVINQAESATSLGTLKAIYGEENINAIIRALEVYAENHPKMEELWTENEEEDT